MGAWTVQPAHLTYVSTGDGWEATGEVLRYIVTNPLGEERAAHALLDDRAVADRLADLLNRLGWDEAKYLDRADDVVAAATENRIRRFLRLNRPWLNEVGIR